MASASYTRRTWANHVDAAGASSFNDFDARVDAAFASLEARSGIPGAVADGVTDDTAALSAAFALGGTRYVLPGSYAFSVNQLVVPNNTRVIASPGATFKPTGSGHAIQLGTAGGASTYKSLTANATEGLPTVTL